MSTLYICHAKYSRGERLGECDAPDFRKTYKTFLRSFLNILCEKLSSWKSSSRIIYSYVDKKDK